jgi:hypothetical protein
MSKVHAQIPVRAPAGVYQLLVCPAVPPPPTFAGTRFISEIAFSSMPSKGNGFYYPSNQVDPEKPIKPV